MPPAREILYIEGMCFYSPRLLLLASPICKECFSACTLALLGSHNAITCSAFRAVPRAVAMAYDFAKQILTLTKKLDKKRIRPTAGIASVSLGVLLWLGGVDSRVDLPISPNPAAVQNWADSKEHSTRVKNGALIHSVLPLQMMHQLKQVLRSLLQSSHLLLPRRSGIRSVGPGRRGCHLRTCRR